MSMLTKRQVKKLIQKGYDLNFISRIQPSGNLNFKENDSYWKQGDGYHKVLHIPYDRYPESGLRNFWMGDLMLLEGVNSFVAVQHASNQELSETATNAISNMLSTQNRKSTEDIDDQARIQSLLDFRARLGNNIPSKLIWSFFHTTGDTEKELRTTEKNIKAQLSQFNISANDGMQDIEFHSAFVPASRQKGLMTRRRGQAVSVLDLGAGYPFNHTSLMDPHGVYLGETRTGGAVNFDLLQEDDVRNTPTMLIAGRSKTGKEKFLGKYLDALFAKGHRIFNIDINGSLGNLTEAQGGKVIRMYGGHNENHLNMMEVVATKTDDNFEDDQIESFRDHREKLKAFAQMKNPALSESDLNDLGTTINELYTQLGLWSPKAESLAAEGLLHTTDVVPEDYPTLKTLVEALNTEYSTAQRQGEDDKAQSYKRLRDAFMSLFNDYRFLDDISEFEDLSDEAVVTFDLSGINDQTLLNIQLYQVLSLVTSYAIINGKKNSQKVIEGTNLEKDQMTHCIITITGAEKLFNQEFSKSLDFLSRMINKISSSYAAVIMEMSDLQNILLSSNTKTADPYILATRKVFASFRYRLFAQVDEVTLPLLANALQGEMTPSELEGLKYLRRGQFFLNIASYKNLMFSQQLASYDDVDVWGMVYSEEERYSSLD